MKVNLSIINKNVTSFYLFTINLNFYFRNYAKQLKLIKKRG